MIVKFCLFALVCGVSVAFVPEPNPYDNPIYFGDEFLQRWNNFRGKFNKVYATQTEEAIRMMMFRMNCMAIDAHNALGDTGFEMGETYFTDFSAREFGKVLGSSPSLFTEDDSGENLENELEARHGGYPKDTPERGDAAAADAGDICNTGPGDDGVDYSTDPCIGPVEHQMTCGSCYAFSLLHVAAWHYCKKNGGKYTNFAEQQIVDCSKKDNGCTSGFTKTSGKYIIVS